MTERVINQRQFFHGTTADAAWAIDREGIQANAMGMVYATTSEERAEMWARRRAEDNDDHPAVVSFTAHDDDITEAAREGEVAHWGHVPPKAIKSIWHLD